MSIPYIEAEGTNYEIGYTIGSRLKKTIQKFLSKEKEYSLGEFRNDETEMHYSYCKKHFPKYFEEIKGIADGSGADLHKILWCNYSLSFSFKRHEFFEPHCTTIGGRGNAGNFYLSHDEDGNRGMKDYLYIAKIKQGKHKSLSLSYVMELPGVICGLNDNKIGYTSNSLYLKDYYSCSVLSAPLGFILRFLLDCSNFRNIEKKIAQFKRTTLMNYSIVHGTRGILGIETTINNISVIRTKSIYYHSNNFLSKDLKRTYTLLESIKKCERIKELVGQRQSVDIPFLKKILADHKYRPISICNHGTYGCGKRREFITVVSMIMDPSNKTMYVAHGNPCKSHFMKYEL